MSACSARARDGRRSSARSASVRRRCSDRRGSMSAPTAPSRSPSASSPRCSPAARDATPATCATNWRPFMSSERTGPIAGIVLAAGTSTRLGRNKLFVELDGETILHRAVRRVIAAGLAPVFVVLGHEADRAREALEGLVFVPVFNADYQRGVNSSVRAGIVAAGDVRAAVVVLADMPFVTSEMIAML